MEIQRQLVIYDASDSSDSEMDEQTLVFPPNYSKWDTDDSYQQILPDEQLEQQTEGEEIASKTCEKELAGNLDNHEIPEIQSDDNARESYEAHASGSTREDVEDDESKDRQPYKLHESLLLPGTKRLLQDVAMFFSKPVNLQRPTAAIGESTREKTRERILCKFNNFDFLVT